MIIFAWKVNNPLSLLISPRASESFKSLFRSTSIYKNRHGRPCYSLISSTLIVLPFLPGRLDVCVKPRNGGNSHSVVCLAAVTAAHRPWARVYETSGTNRIPSEPE